MSTSAGIFSKELSICTLLISVKSTEIHSISASTEVIISNMFAKERSDCIEGIRKFVKSYYKETDIQSSVPLIRSSAIIKMNIQYVSLP